MKKSILLVDDFESALFITEFTLKQAGYKIEKASSGGQALEMAQKHKFDLVISDFNMPKMNGVEFVQKLKQVPNYFGVPVFILSTETNATVKAKAREIGVTAWVKKPFQIADLTQLVNRALR